MSISTPSLSFTIILSERLPYEVNTRYIYLRNISKRFDQLLTDEISKTAVELLTDGKLKTFVELLSDGITLKSGLNEL
ncbi:hypothetical protein RhiirC2_772378 [Rhizophagus irregularis]|uniref:Uncharacterized protein n=1 Tax=Rhizophagus irregularis TaxID=588596 RepID=A0A2N1NRN2_9GLOM|nr:hypothetical protein RhiirC2_772378 [Rhizophagus irregularis]